MKALKIKVDFKTGKRAGGIDPRSKNLRGHPTWQCTKTGWEIRAVLDGDVEKYRGLEGVEILEGEAAIQAALKATCPARVLWKVTNDALLKRSLQQITPDLSGLSQDATPEEELEFLYKAGCKGIGRISRETEPVETVFNA